MANVFLGFAFLDPVTQLLGVLKILFLDLCCLFDKTAHWEMGVKNLSSMLSTTD